VKSNATIRPRAFEIRVLFDDLDERSPECAMSDISGGPTTNDGR